jgi:DMSO/TMAO reductase YedYZ molybdopterin-dependent catalytic subunit
MADALHPQTILTYAMNGADLPANSATKASNTSPI